MKPNPESDAVEYLRAKLVRKREMLEIAIGMNMTLLAKTLSEDIQQIERLIGELLFSRQTKSLDKRK